MDFLRTLCGLTVAEAAKQKKLSEEIQLDAVEMVRRSERALGVAIREGQEAGEIRTKRQGGGGPKSDYVRDGVTVHVVDRGLDETTMSPAGFFVSANERAGIYDMTDDVTDEEFEAGLSIAKEEGNVSRANVVRKVTEIASLNTPNGAPPARSGVASGPACEVRTTRPR